MAPTFEGDVFGVGLFVLLTLDFKDENGAVFEADGEVREMVVLCSVLEVADVLPLVAVVSGGGHRESTMFLRAFLGDGVEVDDEAADDGAEDIVDGRGPFVKKAVEEV